MALQSAAGAGANVMLSVRLPDGATASAKPRVFLCPPADTVPAVVRAAYRDTVRAVRVAGSVAAALTRKLSLRTQEPPPGAWLRLRPHASASDAECEELGDMSAALLEELVQQYRKTHVDAALEVFVAADTGALGTRRTRGSALPLARQRVTPALCAPRALGVCP